jgi:nucleoside-diphosphate-sugar epimerase
MKYIVTGGAGFIGSNIVKKLVSKGNNVTVIDNLYTGKESNLEAVKDKIIFLKDNILNIDLLEKEMKNIDGVFHQAALASVQDSFSKPDEYHNVNVNGTENILKIAKKNNFKVVYASSSSVYGNPEKIPIKESDSKNPINPYAETKLKKEELAVKYSKIGVKVIGLRYFNVFGNGQSKEYAGVVKLFLERIQNKLPPKINGDGLQARDFVFVEDVANANIMAMESNVDHAFFNVGTNTNISVTELAHLMIKAANLDIKPIFGAALKGDVKITIADISLIKKSLGWNPTITIEEWLKQKISIQNN